MVKHNDDTEGTSSAQSLQVEKGETVSLSPESKRFAGIFRRIRPRSASEMRELVGLSNDMAKTLREKGVCCHWENSAAVVSPEDLDSPDESLRARAVAITERALYNYLVGLTPALHAPMEPAFASYIGKAEILIYAATLQDIDVAEGATLSIPATTQLVEANKVILRGSARIDCAGFTKFKVKSIEKA